MPVRKNVPSLKDLCLSSLSSHNENSHHFPHLPYSISETIVNNPKYSQILRPQHLQTIIDQYLYYDGLNAAIHQYTDRIDFYGKPHRLVQRGIALICEVCTNLTHLNLTRTKINQYDLQYLAKSIPNIKSLELSSTSTDDRVLSILGVNCPNLRELDVRHCAITDIGIKTLCEENHGGRCRRIRELRVAGTAVTDEGASTAICNLQDLYHFDYKNILSVLEKIYNSSTESKFKPRLKLETIHHKTHRNILISDSTITATSLMCNNITTVVLTGLRSTDTWLHKLIDFPRLKNLSLTSRSLGDITFSEYVEPLLVTIGNNLKSLYLSRIQGVKLWCIGIHCVELENLSLVENNRYLSTSRNNLTNSKQLFVELRYLRIECVLQHDIPSAQLEILLSNCHNMLVLSLHRCQSITDKLLTRVFEHNSFSELFYLDFLLCNNIQKSSLLSIINICESLRFLKYLRCAQIRDADHHELQRLALNQNLDLTLEYTK